MIRRAIALACLVPLAGCFRTRDLAPSEAYDFQNLHSFARYAQAAYEADDAIRALCAGAFDEVHIQSIPATDNKYFLATHHGSRAHLIAIRGTANRQNALLDADLSAEYVPQLGIRLHRGFAKAALLVYEDARPRLIPGYKVRLTGHSLGGAEAVILAMLLQADGAPAEKVVTFGQPKVTNGRGASRYQDTPLVRVVNGNDIVPAVPPSDYQHIGPELVIFPGPYYSLVNERPLEGAAVRAAWSDLKSRDVPAEISDHFIANYLLRLKDKQSPQNIPYADRIKYIQP